MTATLVGLTLALGAPNLKDKEKGPSLEGVWLVQSVTNNGTPGGVDGGLRYTFTPDGRWLIYRDGKVHPLAGGGSRTYAVDAKSKPPTVDLVISPERGVGSTLLGIFKVEDDTLTICGTEDKRADRPTTFDAPTGSNRTIYVLKRVKKK